MRTNFFLSIDAIKAFDFFRELYNKQLNLKSDCEAAFQDSSNYFLMKYGYQPYENLEDYLSELFQSHNGFQLFDKHI